MSPPRLHSLELRFSLPGAFGVVDEIVVGYAHGAPRHRVRGTHWKSNARTDLLAASLALLSLREQAGQASPQLDSRNGPFEARLCAQLHDLWFSPRKRIESHWLDAVFDEDTSSLPSPLGLVLARSGSREAASFRFASGFGGAQLRFTRGGTPCDAGQLWALLGTRFGIARPLEDSRLPLPSYRTSLIGREQDLERLLSLVRENRLVTIIGPSGVGKTRLAIEVATRADQFAEGARLVDLSAARTREQAEQRVREQVVVAPGDSRPTAELFCDRALLILLDNCETVLEASAELASAILSVSAHCTVLATALEPLAAHGEICYRLHPLALPSDSTSPDEARHAPSVQLFLDRAASGAAQEPPEVDDASLRSILAICRNVGGLPLGIELAAAAARRFSLVDVERLLVEHVDAVEGADRSLPPRHASLRALFTWTAGLLSAEERRILACLSVFPLDWSLDAALAICRAVGIREGAALRGHARLVDLSIVQLDPKNRFTMLPSLRAFAQAALASSAYAEKIRAAFIDSFLQLAESGRGNEGLLLPESQSLRHAALLACEHGDVDRAARFVDALYPFWLANGAWMDGAEICRLALRLPELSPAEEARVLLAAAGLEYRLGEITGARAHYAQARERIEANLVTSDGEDRSSDARGRKLLAHAVHGLGAVAFRSGQLDEAERHFAQAAEIWCDAGDEKDLLYVTNNLAAIAATQGRLEQASERFAAVAELASRSGDRRVLASALMNCGLVQWRQGGSDVARGYFERSLELFRELDDAWGEANVCNSLAVLALEAGELEDCATYHARSLNLRVKLGDRAGIVASIEGFASHAVASGMPARAIRLLAAARSMRAASGLELTADNREAVERAWAQARTQISTHDGSIEEQLGASLTRDEAVLLALAG